MYHRIARTAALLGLALILAASPLRAERVERFAYTANGGVFTLSPAQAEALGAPGADRIAYVDLLAGPVGRSFLAGQVFDARTLLAMTEDADAVRAVLNGEAGRADVVYQGFPLDPLTEGRLQAHRDVPRAAALLFRAADGPVVLAGAQSSVFDGAQTQGPFTGITIGGGGGSLEGAGRRDDGFDFDVPLPTAAAFLVLGAVALYLSRYRFV